MVSLGLIAINGGHIFFPKMLRSIVQKFIVQGLLLKDMRTEMEIEALQKIENDKELKDIASIYEHLSSEVKTKVEGIKLLTRWIYGLKLNSVLGLFNFSIFLIKMLINFSFIVVLENQPEANSNYILYN